MNTDDRLVKQIEAQNRLLDAQNRILDKLATATVRVADAIEKQNSVDPLQAIERALMAGVTGEPVADPMTAPPTAPYTGVANPEIGADEAYRFRRPVRP